VNQKKIEAVREREVRDTVRNAVAVLFIKGLTNLRIHLAQILCSILPLIQISNSGVPFCR